MIEPEPSGSVATALSHAFGLLSASPALAIDQARAILEAAPGHPQAELCLGIAHRLSGDGSAALKILSALASSQPNSADVAFELGVTLGEAGQGAAARTALATATRLRPGHTEAWRALGDQWLLAGDMAAADTAYGRQISASVSEPDLIAAAMALAEGRLGVAEALLRQHLRGHPADAAALRLLSEVAMRLGRLTDAETLLADCLTLAPEFTAARRSYATLLYRINKPEAALAQLDRLQAREPRDPGLRNMRAAVLARIGDFAGAIEQYATVLIDFPQQPRAWMSYGHALKTVGRVPEAIAAYRTAIAQAAALGEAWWSLANLKTFRFSPADVVVMTTQRAVTGLSEEDRLHLDFALGKAHEDSGDYGTSFGHYAAGNALRRNQVDYDAAVLTDHVARAIGVHGARYFAERSEWGHVAPDPIFVVGLPRAGSTLIEQILSSHSAVEGTTELPDIIAIAKRIGGQKTRDQPTLYPEILASMSKAEIAGMGEAYLASTRIQRRTGRPFFIDKMPNNFQHIGLIATILPNARIIDARRSPMACCFAGFKQHFALGQNFSTSLDDLGRYYRDYVALTAHFDRVLPGRIYRVSYEAMVADQESTTRGLLDHLGLPFEQACLDFHETRRAVRTPSAEQVRQPIYASGVEQWRHYEAWLGPLRAALGDVLDSGNECAFG